MNSETHHENKTPAETPSVHPQKRYWKIAVTWALPALIVAGAVLFAKYQIATSPKAKREKPPQTARLVTVQPAQRGDHTTVVTAMGTVVPARRITLAPEVSGIIIAIGEQVIPGGLVEEGQKLIQIDSRDYETIVAQRQSELAAARLNLKLEHGSQTVAQHEYELLSEVVVEQDQELVLRKPHLENAQSAAQAAEAALQKAMLDVQRCTLTAPFNAIIQDKREDLGARVSPASPLLTLIGTDEYWLEVLVPVDQLQWIGIPKANSDKGSAVKIYNPPAWGEGVYRRGAVIRLLGQLEEQGRMAQLLVAVEDPLGLDDETPPPAPILIGSYVHVEIEGKTIESVIPIARDYVRDGNCVWIMNDRGQMEIRPVEIVFRDKDVVYVSGGIREGERIVTTDISSPVEGMPLRLNAAADTNGEPQP